MTIKGKRAGALRKVNPTEAQGGWASGGWVDESFPDAAVEQALAIEQVGIDPAAFRAFYGPRLGRYRMVDDARSSTPSVTDELALIGELLEAVEQVKTRIENMPPMTDAFLNQVIWQRKRVLFHAWGGDLGTQLDELRTLLWLTEREMEPYRGQVGRGTAANRDGLLHDVAGVLEEAAGLGKVKAAGCAAAVLRASGVPAPDDPSEAAKIVRRVRRERGGEIAPT